MHSALMLRAASILSCAGCCCGSCCCLGLLKLKALACSGCVLCFYNLQILHAPLHLRPCSCPFHIPAEQRQALGSTMYSASSV